MKKEDINKDKTITLSKGKLAGILVAIFALSGIGGAFATYQSTLAQKQNAITIQAYDGSVAGTIEEDSWNAANAVNLQPGATVAKDPRVQLQAGDKSFDAWVIMKVTVPKTDAKKARDADWTKYEIVTCDWNTTNFTFLGTTDSTASKIYYYGQNTVVNRGASSAELFQNITVPSDFIAVKTDVNANVDIDAKVLQSEGYATLADAWAVIGKW